MFWAKSIITLLLCTELLEARKSSYQQKYGKPSRLSSRKEISMFKPSDNNEQYGKDWERFAVKHLYPKDEKGNRIDLWTAFDSKKYASNYILDLHHTLIYGGILPSNVDTGTKQITENAFEQSFEDMESKKITILDMDIVTLQSKLQAAVDVYRHEGKTVYELALDKESDNRGFIRKLDFEVEVERLVHITYEVVQKHSPELRLKATYLKGKVKLGISFEMLKKGHVMPTHLDDVDETTMQKLSAVEKTFSFKKSALQKWAKVVEIFWGKFDKKPKEKSNVFNRKNKDYQAIKEKVHSDNIGPGHFDRTERIKDNFLKSGGCKRGRSKRSTGSSCAFYFDSEGKVDEVNPKEFVDKFSELDDAGKTQLAEVVRTNPDKIATSTDDLDTKNMWSLINYESLKAQAVINDAVNSAQRPLILSQYNDNVESNINFNIQDFDKTISNIGSDIKLSPSKISKKIAAITSTNLYNRAAGSTSKVAGAVGRLLLAKSLVGVILKNDTTSRAILGARIGYELVTEIGLKGGTKYAKTITNLNRAKTVGKWVGWAGKITGPIGDLADIGLSTWSIVNSVQILKNATNKYDKYEAIANIVSKAIDIVVTTAVATLSAIFPPGAPFFAAAGLIISVVNEIATLLFGAQNAVNRIDAEIPLSDSEKDMVFASRALDLFGIRKPDYLDYLMAEKHANEIAVTNAVEFLKNNPEFGGYVFPSMTLAADGGCTLSMYHCGWKVGGTCAGFWEPTYLVSKNCDWGRVCSDKGDVCNDYYVEHYSTGYNFYECDCPGVKKAEMKFGVKRKNSFVDLTEKKVIYWERAVPKNYEMEYFLCKPGNQKFSDFKILDENRRLEYECQNAIGVLQPMHRRKPGQIILFDLEDGNDTVFLHPEPKQDNQFSKQHSSSTFSEPIFQIFDPQIDLNEISLSGRPVIPPCMFLMGNSGHKEFVGGTSRNDFVFNSDCSQRLTGRIIGGPDIDTITLGDKCARGRKVTVDFEKGQMYSETYGVNFVKIIFKSIEEFVGRSNQGEFLVADCSTRRIIAQGGSKSQTDEIQVPFNRIGCIHNLTIFAKAHTRVYSRAVEGQVVVLILGKPPGVYVNIDVYSPELLQTTIMLLNISSRDFNATKLLYDGNKVGVLIQSGNNAVFDTVVFDFNFKTDSNKQAAILFNEYPENSPNSVYYLTVSGDDMVYHALPNIHGKHLRRGNENIKNVFHITGIDWSVTGGNKDDEFVLQTSDSGSLDGGNGIDTIKIHPDLCCAIAVDLRSSKFKSIERVIGAQRSKLTVLTSCSTELVATRGGSGLSSDLVVIPNINCIGQNLSTQVLVSGNSQVQIRNQLTKNDKIHIVVDETTSDYLNFSLITETPLKENVLVNLMLKHTTWFLDECSVNGDRISIKFSKVDIRENRIGHINLSFAVALENMSSAHVNLPYVQMATSNSTPGVLAIDRTTCLPKMFYVLDENDKIENPNIYALAGIDNVFKLNVANTHWKIYGGNKNNVFIVTLTNSSNKSFEIVGNQTAVNTLVLQTDELNANVTVDAVHGTLAWNNENGKLIIATVKNMDYVVGQKRATEIVYANCNTKSIDVRGGSNMSHFDVIQISNNGQNCSFNLITVVDEYTRVTNKNTTGNFVYSVKNIMHSTIDLLPSLSSSHAFQFNYSHLSLIRSVAFNEKTSKLSWILSEGSITRQQDFKMIRHVNSERYENPTFQFLSPDRQLSSEMFVESNGATQATTFVYGVNNSDTILGLPVDINKFVINITAPFDITGSKVQGCTDNCSINHFFLLNLNITLDTLNGGNCLTTGCSNLLHFSEKFAEDNIKVNLDINNGSVIGKNDNVYIQKLQNINEFHGHKNTTVIATCNTTKVTGVGKIEIFQENCKMNLIIGVEEYTEILFYNQDEANSIWEGNFHYQFSKPMSFDLSGYSELVQNQTHTYYLPFTLDEISYILFDNELETIFYKLHEMEEEFSLNMFFSIDMFEQFYSKPNLITKDGFLIQVASDGSIMLTWGGTSSQSFQTQLPDLQATASRLGVTMLIQTPSNFYFIGHSTSPIAPDRNVLQNAGDTTSHLAGGGADNTIYEIVGLDKNVYLYTGFTEEDLENWQANLNGSKQTIDLTGIVVPIRMNSEAKYVPTVQEEDGSLIIAIDGFEALHPGKVYIINGTKPWVSKRLQLLLSHSLMDLVHVHTLKKNATNSTRNRRSFKSQWKIQPRPLLLHENIRIYSISPTDLENGQEILLQSQNSEVNSTSVIFQPARNGKDLHVTNLMNMGTAGAQTLLLSDFYDNPGDKEEELTFLNTYEGLIHARNIKISLHGLSLVLDGGSLWQVNNDTSVLIEPDFVKPLDRVFQHAEEKLLENFPDIPRVFQEKSNIPVAILVSTFLFVAAGLFALCITSRIKKRKFYVVNRKKKDSVLAMEEVKMKQLYTLKV